MVYDAPFWPRIGFKHASNLQPVRVSRTIIGTTTYGVLEYSKKVSRFVVQLLVLPAALLTVTTVDDGSNRSPS